MRSALRLVLLLGAVGVAFVFLAGGPKDVVLEYDLAAQPTATRLEVDLRRGSELVRHAEFRLPGKGETIVRHQVRLAKGAYTLAWRLAVPGGAVTGERSLDVEEEGTIVLALGG